MSLTKTSFRVWPTYQRYEWRAPGQRAGLLLFLFISKQLAPCHWQPLTRSLLPISNGHHVHCSCNCETTRAVPVRPSAVSTLTKHRQYLQVLARARGNQVHLEMDMNACRMSPLSLVVGIWVGGMLRNPRSVLVTFTLLLDIWIDILAQSRSPVRYGF